MSDLAKVERKKEKSQGFAALGIPIGSTLIFKKDPAVTVKTLDDKNKVEYLGKPYSISTLAKQLVGSPVSGYLYFKFEGKVLKNLDKTDTAESPKPAEAPVPVPAEESAEPPESAEIPDTPAESDVPAESEPNIDPLADGVEVDTAV
jgi:hypothetical protein